LGTKGNATMASSFPENIGHICHERNGNCKGSLYDYTIKRQGRKGYIVAIFFRYQGGTDHRKLMKDMAKEGQGRRYPGLWQTR